MDFPLISLRSSQEQRRNSGGEWEYSRLMTAHSKSKLAHMGLPGFFVLYIVVNRRTQQRRDFVFRIVKSKARCDGDVCNFRFAK